MKQMEMNSSEIRQSFLDFFASHGHRKESAGPLLPDDPSLLFTNAGMVQFKDVFLGRSLPPSPRVATAQPCLRAGGKHNDLDQVGHTKRHHTLFEMLGNFSFGDYFKREAISFAWKFLCECLRIPEDRLWVTVHHSDDEAERVWINEIGIDPKRITRLGEDNFWQMGETGPCGPCSEIFYDHGPEVSGGPPGSADGDGDRYVEIWNLVFMQFERGLSKDLAPLPKPCVDTGMGLERICAALQGVSDNYATDLFTGLLTRAGEITGCDDPAHPALRILADHMRSSSFLLAEGLVPSNEGAGSVLRRIIRRAARNGHRLGLKEPFLHLLLDALMASLDEAYPKLQAARTRIETALREEEEQFSRTLDQGMRLLEEAISGLSSPVLPGDLAFRLYDTYGFPLDLTEDVAKERGLSVDRSGFEAALSEQQQRSRSASVFIEATSSSSPALPVFERLGVGATHFLGYQRLKQTAQALCLLDESLTKGLDALHCGDRGVVVLDQTPFYAEGGGQIGDSGELRAPGLCFVVEHTAVLAMRYLHYGRLEYGSIQLDLKLTAQVDGVLRRETALHHSATHLLHASLRRVLGDHVAQKGSLVTPHRLRFDFSHSAAVGRDELIEIEALVNQQILDNTPIKTEIMTQDAARSRGALAMFGEKYGEQVRVLSIGRRGFSVELCGGTHARRSGDIGCLRIVSESSVAAGVRRIEAVVGKAALRHIRETEEELDSVARLLSGRRGDLVERIGELQRAQHDLRAQLKTSRQRASGVKALALLQAVREHPKGRLLIESLGAGSSAELHAAMDEIKQRLSQAIIVLVAVDDESGKASIAVSVGEGLEGAHAGELAALMAGKLGGKGGGNQSRGQGGASPAKDLAQGLDDVRDHVAQLLSA